MTPDKTNTPNSTFLTAEWRNLAMLNYEVDTTLLREYVPSGVELDQWNGRTFMSLVGFSFLNTKVLGLPIPLHRNFEEVNLRFYVRRNTGNEIRRGVVFIKEIVPKPAIALTARWVYGENYVSLPVQHKVVSEDDSVDAEYSWRKDDSMFRLFASSQSAPSLPTPRSLEQYITEHYWGYARQNSGDTVEYHVVHVSWGICMASEGAFSGNGAGLYGKEFGEVLSRPPNSAYIAKGSPVVVYRGEKLR